MSNRLPELPYRTPETPLTPDVGMFIPTIPVPSYCIDGIEIHEQSGDIIWSQPDIRVDTEDWISKNAVLTIPTGDQGVWTHFYEGRTLRRGFGKFIVNGQHNGTVLQKGGFLSGIFHGDVKGAYQKLKRWYYPGFETRYDDEGDANITTGLLGEDFRTSFRFGRLLLKTEETRTLLLEAWKENWQACRIIDKVFELAHLEGYDFTLTFRFVDTPARISYDGLVSGKHTPSPETIRQNISDGAWLLLQEIREGCAFKQVLRKSSFIPENLATETLQTILKNTQITENQLLAYRSVYALQFAQNYLALGRFQKSHSLLGTIETEDSELGKAKDTGYTGAVYDMDCAYRDPAETPLDTDIVTHQYLHHAGGTMQILMKQMLSRLVRYPSVDIDYILQREDNMDSILAAAASFS